MAGDKAEGRFVWFDLMTTDPEAAVEFYTKVVGWGTTKWDGPSDQPYTMWTAGEAPIGGVMPLPDEVRKMGAPPSWMGYVGTADVDAAAKKAESLGGKLMMPAMDIPTIGRFAVLGDPQGATIAVFTAESDAPGHDGPPNHGEISWHELMTTDYEAAFEFYHAMFGWDKLDAMDMGPAGIYQMYGRGDVPLGGMFNKPDDMPAPPMWLYYAHVDDVNKRAEIVKKNGGKVINGPMEVPGGDWIVQCTDPQGGMFALHHRK